MLWRGVYLRARNKHRKGPDTLVIAFIAKGKSPDATDVIFLSPFQRKGFKLKVFKSRLCDREVSFKCTPVKQEPNVFSLGLSYPLKVNIIVIFFNVSCL